MTFLRFVVPFIGTLRALPRGPTPARQPPGSLLTPRKAPRQTWVSGSRAGCRLFFPEMADAVETVIFAAPNVLWLADGDTGYGKALAVQKTIRAYERRGAAAVLIEDKVWPRPLGRGGAKLVIERDAALLRCRAAPPRRHVARRASCRSTTQVIFRLRRVVRPPAAARARPWSPRPLCSGSA